ncbi:MAG: flagellar filament capping protein FliD [Pirellulales bacterium]|nr:flagellar filament capping protein FliD [Pirellulales bacterium]
MSRITSSIGLITGIPIEDTVNQLMQLAARPRDLLVSRNKSIQDEQTAVNTLSTRLLGFQFAINKLKSTTVYSSRTVTSSNKDALSAAVPSGTTPPAGTVVVRPVRTASSQQLLSQRFESLDASLSTGSLSLRMGGFVNKGAALEVLNGGAGVPAGKIKITDRSGASATIDLTYAQSVDDVLVAINQNAEIGIQASVVGDSFRLTDVSGGSGNLIVAEVAGGSTAAGLGLAGINTAASVATGGDVFRLYDSFRLAQLNDGNGVDFNAAGIADVEIAHRNGTTTAVDLSGAATIKDVLDKLNAAGGGKVAATIASDGNRLQLVDLTTGGGTFAVANGTAGRAATDLGLDAAASGGTIAGKRIVSGLADSLLSRLGGGAGLGSLGTLQITDRGGAVATVNLASAETLSDVLELINASSASVTAAVNEARNGIVVVDESGGSGSLTIASGDATNAAEKLGIAFDAAAGSTDGGSLNRQIVSRATLLSSLNSGKGVKFGDVRITDTAGVSRVADFNTVGSEPKTLGDVIDVINALDNGVEARINDTGDGIVLVDTARGSGKLAAVDVGGDIGKTLGLTRPSKVVSIDGVDTQVVDGSATRSIDLTNLGSTADSVLLSSLNSGAGIALGDVRIDDSNGKSIYLDLNGGDAGISTVGDLINLINQRAEATTGFSVRAKLNAAGTGILLEDDGGGSQTIKAVDLNSTTAADLKLTGSVVRSGGKQQLAGNGLFPAVASAGDGLSALAKRINELGLGVTAGTLFDGVGYRLSLTVDASGSANELLVDALGTGFKFTENSRAQDALLAFGEGNVLGSGVLLSSSTNSFKNSIGGLDLTIAAGSDKPVTLTVASSDSSLVSTVQEVVDAYNSLRSDLGELTSFDASSLTTGLLFGTREAIAVDQLVSRVLTDRFFGVGNFQALEQLGLSVGQDGKMELNRTRLQNAFAEDPAGVEQFFTNADRGFITKLNAQIDRLIDSKNGAFGARFDALQSKVDANLLRIDQLASQLDRQRERLLLQFAQLESIIARMQSNQQALENLQIIPPLTSSRRSS